ADGAEGVRRALRSAGIGVLENHALLVTKNGQRFWVAGLGDQIGEPKAHWRFRSLDDLAGTLAQIKDPAPVILLAHEPAIFQRVPDRVSLTLCGHTHGGQVNLPIFSQRFLRHYYGIGLLYGHIVKRDRHLIISAGLGTSYAPVRFMRPPEVVELIIGGCGRNPELGPNPTWRNRTGPAGILIAAERRFPLEGRGRSCRPADRHRSCGLVFSTKGTGENSHGSICPIGRVIERDIDPGALGRNWVWRWPSACRSQKRALERSGSTCQMRCPQIPRR
ncbi:MAG: metallophosphoesterase, partial [Methylocella sp.]